MGMFLLKTTYGYGKRMFMRRFGDCVVHTIFLLTFYSCESSASHISLNFVALHIIIHETLNKNHTNFSRGLL